MTETRTLTEYQIQIRANGAYYSSHGSRETAVISLNRLPHPGAYKIVERTVTTTTSPWIPSLSEEQRVLASIADSMREFTTRAGTTFPPNAVIVSRQVLTQWASLIEGAVTA